MRTDDGETVPGALAGFLDGDMILYTGGGFERWRPCEEADAEHWFAGIPYEYMGELDEEEAFRVIV